MFIDMRNEEQEDQARAYAVVDCGTTSRSSHTPTGISMTYVK